MEDKLAKLCKNASEIIQSYPKLTKIRVISHYDADGISSAAIISRALYRNGYNIHTTLMRNPFDKGLERVSKEENELIIFLDMGSGQIETIEKINCKSIIVDHHQALKKKTSEKILQINANLCDINGNYEACGATLTYCLAKALDEKNKDLITLAITGLMGDKQYIGGIRGYNNSIIKEALSEGILKETIEMKLYGNSLFEALYFSIDPYFLGISGNEKAIKDIIKRLNLKEDVKIEDLSPAQKKNLHSLLMLRLIKKGCEKNILDTVIRPRYFSDVFNCELERLADLIDSCGKGGNRGIGLSLLLGDKQAFDKALELEKEYKQKIIDELLKLESDGFKEKNSYRYFYSNDSSLGGVIGGIATNFMLDNTKPLISIVKNKDEIHVSCRGNQQLVKNGLDLGSAMKEVSTKLGGHGGGHAIASGATLELSKEEEFLEEVDKIIIKQMEK